MSSSVTPTVRERVAAARNAAKRMGTVDGVQRAAALRAIAGALRAHAEAIHRANERDLARAAESSLAAPLVKRLRFDTAKLEQAIVGSGIGGGYRTRWAELLRRELDTGLVLTKQTSPIGVVAMIFESRPDALVQIASLALKSGNAIVLKGGSEALESNRTLADIIATAGTEAGIPAGWLQLIETRSDVTELLALDDLVDLMIPRGSNEFVRYIMDNTRIPVLGHADGICHVFLDAGAEVRVAVDVTVDAKTQYVAVCNAVETLLVHAERRCNTSSEVAAALIARGVELRGCPRTREILPDIAAATEEDWRAEYLDLTLAVKIVDSLEEAIEHINTYGSGHTDAIVTADEGAAERFLAAVDSASVMWNASTRFADGFRYGLGAEVGISTAKIHARGPVGVEGLLSHKWILRGSGHSVTPYSDGERHFTHRDLSTE